MVRLFSKRLSVVGVLLVVFSFVVVPFAIAQEKEAAKDEEELRTGVVSSFGNFQRRADVDDATGSEAAGDKPSPIGGSVSRISSSQCRAMLKNSSEKNRYSVRYEVVGMRDGSKAFSKRYSATLAPGKSVEKRVRCSKGMNMQLRVLSGSKG
jgi:hypothetical protein